MKELIIALPFISVLIIVYRTQVQFITFYRKTVDSNFTPLTNPANIKRFIKVMYGKEVVSPKLTKLSLRVRFELKLLFIIWLLTIPFAIFIDNIIK